VSKRSIPCHPTPTLGHRWAWWLWGRSDRASRTKHQHAVPGSIRYCLLGSPRCWPLHSVCILRFSSNFHPLISPTSPGAVTCFNSLIEEAAFFQNTIVSSINYTIAGKFDQQDQDELFSRTDADSNLLIDFGIRCKNGPVGKYLQYIGTSSTVRDLVSLGDAIAGQGKPIDYWGFSYGTVIGVNFLNSESIIEYLYGLFLIYVSSVPRGELHFTLFPHTI
jgi:hypothetical protein